MKIYSAKIIMLKVLKFRFRQPFMLLGLSSSHRVNHHIDYCSAVHSLKINIISLPSFLSRAKIILDLCNTLHTVITSLNCGHLDHDTKKLKCKQRNILRPFSSADAWILAPYNYCWKGCNSIQLLLKGLQFHTIANWLNQ